MSAFIASVLVPIITDFIKSSGPAISRKVFGETVDDQIKIATADVERLKALAALDNPGGTPSQWVVDMRASFRYIAACALILGGLGLALYGAFGAALVNPELVVLGMDLAAAPFGFIFGERLLINRRK